MCYWGKYVFLAMMCLLACVDVVWAQRATIRAISFEGVRIVSNEMLKKDLVMRPGMPFDSTLVVKDMQRVLALYRERGYWHAQIHYPDIAIDNGQTRLRYRVVENGPTRLDTLILQGNVVFEDTDLVPITALSKGTILTSARLDAQLERFLQFYENRGYPFCVLKPDVVFGDQNVRVVVDVDAGPLCRVDSIRFEGNIITRTDVLLRETGLQMGVVYDQRMIDRATDGLRRLPFLLGVKDPEVRRVGDVTMVVIGVQEARTARVEGGVGYAPQATGNGITGSFSLHIHNVGGAGRLGQVAWQRTGVGASDLHIEAQEPWVFGMPFSAEIALDMRERVGYSEWAVQVGSAVRAWTEGRVWVNMTRAQVMPDSAGLGVYEKSNRWSVALGVSGDYRDDVWNPRGGWMGQTAFEVSRVMGGAQTATRRFQRVDVQSFYSITGRSVLALGGYWRWVDQADGVPVDGLVRLGGARTIRGYREEAFLTDHAGWVSLEWRYVVGQRSRVFGFVDTGILSDLTGRMTPLGYGVGLVLQSQMGMVGFDVGWAKEDGFGDGKVHVRVVNAF